MLEKFRALAYKLYPKGLSPDSDIYLESEEYKTLMKIFETKEKLSKAWQIFKDITKNIIVPFNYELVDIDDINKYDRSFKVLLFNKTLKQSYGICISLVIEHFSVYEVKYLLNKQAIILPIEFNTNDNMQMLILKAIETNFPFYKEFPLELVDFSLENIAFANNGILLNESHSRFLKKMTFFNAFFCDNYYW